MVIELLSRPGCRLGGDKFGQYQYDFYIRHPNKKEKKYKFYSIQGIRDLLDGNTSKSRTSARCLVFGHRLE